MFVQNLAQIIVFDFFKSFFRGFYILDLLKTNILMFEQDRRGGINPYNLKNMFEQDLLYVFQFHNRIVNGVDGRIFCAGIGTFRAFFSVAGFAMIFGT